MTYAPSAWMNFFGSAILAPFSPPAATPQQRTEHFTPGHWTLGVSSSAGGVNGRYEFVRGRNEAVRWEKAVTAPALAGTRTGVSRDDEGTPWAWRHEDIFDLALPMFGDAAGRPRVPYLSATDTGSIELYRDGQLVASLPSPAAARIPVPQGDAAYRLDATVHRDAPWWTLATTVSASWTFRSSPEHDGTALPLLTARFDPELDLSNRAGANQPLTIPVHVDRQDTGSVDTATVAVEVSTDDGIHWLPVPVARAGDHWTVTVHDPTSGYVSLRAHVLDPEGNGVTETVIRAYQIRT